MNIAFIAMICLKGTKYLSFLSQRINIYCLRSNHTLLPVLWPYRVFEKNNNVILFRFYDINFIVYVYFHVREDKCKYKELRFSTSVSLPVKIALFFFIFVVCRVTHLYFCTYTLNRSLFRSK